MIFITIIFLLIIVITILIIFRYGLSVPLSALSATEGRPLSLNFDFN